jgi:hypothetical protein
VTERVDQDRLADFVGGALEGTPDDDAVRALIESDPGWAAAHADLVAATAAVSADLRTVGSRPHAVPDDVAARLDALLRHLESDQQAGTASLTATDDAPGPARDVGSLSATGGPGRTGPRGSAAAGTRGSAAAGAGGPGGSSRPGGTGPGRRARRMRWAAGLSAAAAVIAFGIGFVSLLPGTRSSDSAATAPQGADSAGGGAAPEAAGAPTPIANGNDYRPGAFGALGAEARSKSQATAAAPPGAQGGTPRQGAAGDAPNTYLDDATRANIPTELNRLTTAAALQDCLDAIRQLHGGTPSVVEYARFTSRPALVVLLDGSTTGSGRQWVVVAGPDCGLVPGDVDELYNGPLT